MHCPKCRVADRVKNGKVQGKQRYRCKGCGCNYTVSSLSRTPLDTYYAFIAPVGYAYAKSRTHGKILVRDEPAASVLSEALEGFAAGRFQTAQEVRVFLENAPEFPKQASGKIGNARAKDILTNPLYAGMIVYEPWGISLRKGHHEGLISYETFCRNQDRLAGRASPLKRRSSQSPRICSAACGITAPACRPRAASKPWRAKSSY